jgi:hypothetical protein
MCPLSDPVSPKWLSWSASLPAGAHTNSSEGDYPHHTEPVNTQLTLWTGVK